VRPVGSDFVCVKATLTDPTFRSEVEGIRNDGETDSISPPRGKQYGNSKALTDSEI